MTTKELERIKVLSQVRDRKLSQILASKILGISDRQIRKLLKKIELHGDKSILSKKRGKPSNRCLPNDLKSNVLKLIKTHYVDFGPKLAGEYLRDNHRICVSKETLRRWMIEAKIWIPKNKRSKKLHPLRERRRAFGELIQVDGSHHDWFEGRGPSCVLMVFIDDATSKITSLHFAKGETLEAYYRGLEKHLNKYGIPLSIYGDKCSVLVARSPKDENFTQFHRSLKELNCELILALSPQAKGKVERVNRTLQDRLVKELRLKGISTIEEANAVVDEYIKKHNKLFSKKPSEQANAHRSLEGICLKNVLCTRKTRTLSKDFIVQFENTFYKISSQQEKVKLFKGGKVEIRELMNGERIALFSGKPISMTPLYKVECPNVVDAKEILHWHPKKKYIPPDNHPYRHKYFLKKAREEMLLQLV